MNPQYEAHGRLCKAIGDMAKENEAMKQRIKRLEEAGDAILNSNNDDEQYEAMKQWHKVKEAKP